MSRRVKLAGILQLEAPAEVDVPESLLPEEKLKRLIEERKPRYVPLEGAEAGASPFPPPDPSTGTLYPSPLVDDWARQFLLIF